MSNHSLKWDSFAQSGKKFCKSYSQTFYIIINNSDTSIIIPAIQLPFKLCIFSCRLCHRSLKCLTLHWRHRIKDARQDNLFQIFFFLRNLYLCCLTREMFSNYFAKSLTKNWYSCNSYLTIGHFSSNPKTYFFVCYTTG